MNQRTGAPVTAAIPDMDVAQRERMGVALLIGEGESRGLLEDAVALGVEGEIRGEALRLDGGQAFCIHVLLPTHHIEPTEIAREPVLFDDQTEKF